MAGKTDVFETALLNLIFKGTAIANLADNAASSPLTSLYVSLHTSEPLDAAASGQSTNEIAYTNYARKAVVRGAGWTVTGNSVSPAAQIDFNAGTGGSGTANWFGVGSAASGTGVLYYYGAISPAIVCGSGVTPSLTVATAITED